MENPLLQCFAVGCCLREIFARCFSDESVSRNNAHLRARTQREDERRRRRTKIHFLTFAQFHFFVAFVFIWSWCACACVCLHFLRFHQFSLCFVFVSVFDVIEWLFWFQYTTLFVFVIWRRNVMSMFSIDYGIWWYSINFWSALIFNVMFLCEFEHCNDVENNATHSHTHTLPPQNVPPIYEYGSPELIRNRWKNQSSKIH